MATIRIADSKDDVNESWFLGMKSKTLWLGKSYNPFTNFTGLRFRDLPIPPGAKILNTYLRVFAERKSDTPIKFIIRAEDSGKSKAFTNQDPPSLRVLTNHKVEFATKQVWKYREWYTIPHLESLVQEVVNRPDWVRNSNFSLLVEGKGNFGSRRYISSFDGNPNEAPRLVVVYTVPQNQVRHTLPVFFQ